MELYLRNRTPYQVTQLIPNRAIHIGLPRPDESIWECLFNATEPLLSNQLDRYPSSVVEGRWVLTGWLRVENHRFHNNHWQMNGSLWPSEGRSLIPEYLMVTPERAVEMAHLWLTNPPDPILQDFVKEFSINANS